VEEQALKGVIKWSGDDSEVKGMGLIECLMGHKISQNLQHMLEVLLEVLKPHSFKVDNLFLCAG